MDQYPVTYEPDQNMNHVETYGVHPEEDVGGQRRQGPRQHALWQGLQQDGVWDHRRPELDPPDKYWFKVLGEKWQFNILTWKMLQEN